MGESGRKEKVYFEVCSRPVHFMGERDAPGFRSKNEIFPLPWNMTSDVFSYFKKLSMNVTIGLLSFS